MIKKLETMAAAVSFAEAGEFDTARRMLAELGNRYANQKRKIILASNNLPLRTEPMEYALGLASRLKYDTLFLDILNGRKGSEAEVREHAAGFKDLFRDLAGRIWPAQRPEVVCEHAVLRGEFCPLLREACRTIHGVELVIVQKHKNEPCAHGLQVPVFCFDM